MPSDLPPFKITIRPAKAWECELPWSRASYQEAAALQVGSALVALYDEYGTAYVNPDLKLDEVWNSRHVLSPGFMEDHDYDSCSPLELLAKLATDIYAELLK